MTVKELIAALQMCDPEANVIYYDSTNGIRNHLSTVSESNYEVYLE